ncbi:MAG: hypothetical protein EA392_02170 [Cryomorphaceae bacterium]|nr:MAG: hypothetical protein EA392_02170 [Cryomorphaceae bacterium]
MRKAKKLIKADLSHCKSPERSGLFFARWVGNWMDSMGKPDRMHKKNRVHVNAPDFNVRCY